MLKTHRDYPVNPKRKDLGASLDIDYTPQDQPVSNANRKHTQPSFVRGITHTFKSHTSMYLIYLNRKFVLDPLDLEDGTTISDSHSWKMGYHQL